MLTLIPSPKLKPVLRTTHGLVSRHFPVWIGASPRSVDIETLGHTLRGPNREQWGSSVMN